MNRSSLLSSAPAPSIRTNLVMLVIGCILPIASISAFLIFNFYEHEQTRLISDAISRTRAMVSAIDRDFSSVQASLQALSTSNRLSTGDLTGFRMRALEVLPNIRAESIEILDPAGKLLVTTLHPSVDQQPALESPPILKRTLATGHPGISDLYRGPISGELVVSVSVPVVRNGTSVYYLLATIAPSQIADILTEQKLPTTWRAAITDGSGNIAARSHAIEKYLGLKLNDNILRQLSTSNEGSLRNKTTDGIDVLSVFSQSPTSNWAVAMGMPLDEVTAGLRQTLLHLIIATFTALIVGLSLAWFIGGRIAHSVTEIGEKALALTFGQKLTIPRLHVKEANELAEALLKAESTLQKSRYDAHHDALTGLANRTLFYIVVDQQLALCQRDNTPLAILYIDLDGFKAVNDSYGHAIGDQLLRVVSIRIRDAIRDADIAARLGGDEFAVALIHSDLENARLFAGKLIELIAAPYQLGDVQATISASVGIAGYPDSATEIDTLLKQADKSMYQAKSLGKHRYHITL